jgi:3-oxoacyl-[acyl-carrier protein] reductase
LREENASNVIAFAVSPPARWMTGTVLRMDRRDVKSI